MWHLIVGLTWELWRRGGCCPALFGPQLDGPPETGGAHSYVGGALKSFPRPFSQRGPLPPFLSACPPPMLHLLLTPHDRGAVRAAEVRGTCQQGDHVSSKPAHCLSHCHADWQPASADYRQCGSKRIPVWQWQAYDLQNMLILSNQHFIQGLSPCHPSLENTLLGR